MDTTDLKGLKEEGVVYWTRSQTQTEGTYSRHVPRCKVAVLVETKSTTIGLLLHERLTKSTSNTDMLHENTSSIDSQRPHEAIPNPF